MASARAADVSAGKGWCPCRVSLPGQAEVENLHLSAARYEEIGRLDVHVNDLLGVGCLQAADNLFEQLQNFEDLQRPFLNDLLQRLAFQRFHDDERVSVPLTDIVERADVGMVER